MVTALASLFREHRLVTGRLQGRVAIVTGAGNGVGHAIAHSLAAQGASVVVNDLGTTPTGGGMSSDAADATVAEIRAAGGVAVANYDDSVADKDGCANLVRTAEEAFGPVDILIANAGAVLPGSIDATDEQFAARDQPRPRSEVLAVPARRPGHGRARPSAVS